MTVYAAGWAVRLFGVAPVLGQRLALAAGLLALATIVLPALRARVVDPA